MRFLAALLLAVVAVTVYLVFMLVGVAAFLFLDKLIH